MTFLRGAISGSGLDIAPVWTRQVRNPGPDSGTLALVSIGIKPFQSHVKITPPRPCIMVELGHPSLRSLLGSASRERCSWLKEFTEHMAGTLQEKPRELANPEETQWFGGFSPLAIRTTIRQFGRQFVGNSRQFGPVSGNSHTARVFKT